MKKTKLMVAAFAVAALTSCGAGAGSTTANGSNDVLGAVASSMIGGMAGNAGNTNAGNLASAGLSILNTLLGGGQVNTNSIQGKWTYAQPQVSFESQNTLSKLGGELMGNKIESMLSTQLQKIGLKPGVSSFTFQKDGTVVMQLNNKTTNGTYKLNGNTLTLTGAMGMTSLTCTVTINGGQLYMLFDANALFSAITKLGSNVSSIKALLGSFNGMKLGWSMTR